MAVLLAIQPTGLLALADDTRPATFTVVGVAAATLRIAPDGSSMPLVIVPAGSVVTVVGPDEVAADVIWRQVRTAEGHVGYLPAGLLASESGIDSPGDPPTRQSASGPAAAPSQSVGSVPPRSPMGVPAQSVGAVSVQATADSSPAGGEAGSGDVGSGGTPSQHAAHQPTPAPTPEPSPMRTTVERRRGRDVTITHFAEQTAPNGRTMGAGRIVVGFKPGASPQGQAAAHRAAGTVSARPLGRAEVMAAQVAPGTVQQALATYRNRSDVAWAEPDYVYRATLTTNDPYVGSQWGPAKIGAPIAWDVTTGEPSTLIAILDTGVYTESSTFVAPDGLTGHPDLRGKVVLERDFSDSGTGPDDWYDHGTLMAGIAAARTNTGPAEGIAGVGYNVRLLNGKVLNDTGSGLESWVAEGITWAADNGAKVISMSLSDEGPCSQTLQTAIDYAWAKNVVVVASAGNGGADAVGDPAPESPANCNHVISVGAIDVNDARPGFSNYGPGVALAAPGVDIVSTDNFGTYRTVSGTSPAAPHVAAVAGLLVSTPHGASNHSIATRVLQTADPIVGTGTVWGQGRINAAAAVGPTSCSPRPPVTISSAPVGSVLTVAIKTSGVGNAVRFIRTGTTAGAALNALVSFPTASSDVSGTTTYVPRTVGTGATFQVRREAASSPTTLPFIVTDGCGTWKSFVGGGTDAGF